MAAVSSARARGAASDETRITKTTMSGLRMVVRKRTSGCAHEKGREVSQEGGDLQRGELPPGGTLALSPRDSSEAASSQHPAKPLTWREFFIASSCRCRRVRRS